MQPDSSPQDNVSPPQTSSSHPQPTGLKLPRPVLDPIFAFPPNRDTLGGTAYLIVENLTAQNLGTQGDGKIDQVSLTPYLDGAVNILIDCPAWNQTNAEFLRQLGGVSVLLITHRGGIGRVREIQETLGCKILIQEQEAYLLPGLDLITFADEFTLSPSCQAIWTPGHSPGSACLYYNFAGGVLFSGRHLLPNPQGELLPLRTAKTFHWRRQIQNVQFLINRFTPETLNYICPGANTGFLRGQGVIDRAYARLIQLDLDAQL